MTGGWRCSATAAASSTVLMWLPPTTAVHSFLKRVAGIRVRPPTLSLQNASAGEWHSFSPRLLSFFHKKYFNFQNAWQNEYPKEFVEFIQLDIPTGSEVDNPIEDAALMARIGAKKICGFTNWFELKNAVTGTRFTFEWGKYDDVLKSNFTLQRNEWCVNETRMYNIILPSCVVSSICCNYFININIFLFLTHYFITNT